MKLSEKEVREVIEGAEEVACEPWKWGTRRRYVFERDSKHWAFWVEYHVEEGLQLYGDVECEEVHKVHYCQEVWEAI